jgi:predicted nucleotide-binding protein
MDAPSAVSGMPSPRPRVLLIDDDRYHLGLLARYLDDTAFSVTRADSVSKALAAADAGELDLVIMDVRMPDEGIFPSEETHAGYETGIPLARAIRARHPDVRILALTASLEASVQEWFTRDATVAYLAKPTSRKPVLRAVKKLLGLPKEPPQIFIVHGRDPIVRELKDYVQNVLNLGEPIVLADQPSRGRTILEKFEHHAAATEVAFVLMTPDDLGGLADSPDASRERARQNVIFELGYFLGFLTRNAGRVIVLHKPPLEVPSDLAGLCYVDISHGIARAGEEIRRELREWL